MLATTQNELPWSRLENEPDLWYGRFVKYAMPFGYDFTPDRAYRLFQYDQVRLLATTLDTDALVFWQKEADRWDWEHRAKYNADEETIVTQTIWRQRQLELLEQDWQLGNDLRGVVNTVLQQYELYLAEHKDGAKPGIGMQHLVTAAKQASDTQRLTLAMPTQIMETREKKQVVMYLPEVEEAQSESDVILEQRSDSSSSDGNNDSNV